LGSLEPHNLVNKWSLEEFPSLISTKSHEQASEVPILPQLCMDKTLIVNFMRVFGGVVICQTQSMLLGYGADENSGLCMEPLLE